jgi:hypothetical protein
VPESKVVSLEERAKDEKKAVPGSLLQQLFETAFLPLALADSRSVRSLRRGLTWGFRWIDAKEAEPTLIRAMFYDPENQEWDENSITIGTRHCGILRPYFESELIRADLTRLARAA